MQATASFSADTLSTYLADINQYPLLTQAILKLRDRRIDRGLAAAARDPDRPLSARVRDLWPALVAEEGHVLDQAIGLSMYDPARYAALGHGASQQYLPALLSLPVGAT